MAQQITHQGHTHNDGKPSGHQRKSGTFRCVPQQFLYELRNQHRARQQREADHKHHHISHRERSVLEQMQIDDGILMMPFPETYCDQRHY